AALNDHSQQTASQKSGKKSKPWKKKKLQFYPEDVSGQVHLVLANGIYVEKENLQPRMQNTLRRMAAYSNPQYYKNHAMGFSAEITRGLWHVLKILMIISAFREGSKKACQKS